MERNRKLKNFYKQFDMSYNSARLAQVNYNLDSQNNRKSVSK